MPAHRKYPQLHDAAWLNQRYAKDGLCMTALADEIGCSLTAVYKALHAAGVETRSAYAHHITHGHAPANANSSTYRIWIGMKVRCDNANSVNFKYYGGRGISVCARWHDSFENFLADMGERPAGLSIDRINVDGNYEPENCRWATQSEQLRNRRPQAA